MIENTRNWFVGLSRRERLLIGIAGLLVTAMVGYYGIAQPISGATAAAEQRYDNAVERQARIEARVAALRLPVDGRVTRMSGAIDVVVSQSAGETGIAVASIDPQSDNRVTMVVESAKPTALFGWLARMERQGIAVESLSVNPAGNGAVSGTLTLRSH